MSACFSSLVSAGILNRVHVEVCVRVCVCVNTTKGARV